MTFQDPDRRFTDPNLDPSLSDPVLRSEYRRGNNTWGWIAGIAFVVIVLALIFSFGNTDMNTANNVPGSATTATAPSLNGQRAPGMIRTPATTPPASAPTTTGSGPSTR